MTLLDEFLQLPSETQDGGALLWSSGNTGIRGQMFEIYAAEEFQTGGPSASDILAKRGVSSTAELLQHLLHKPILVTEAAFASIKNIQPFALADLQTAVGSLGNLRALSGPAAVKILLEVDAQPPEKKNSLQAFLSTVYQEEPVRAGSAWRPAPIDDKARRQFAFIAFLHGLHALAAVTVTIDPLNPADRVPPLQATLPARYIWVTSTLSRQAEETGGTLLGLKRPEVAHFLADMFETLDVPLPEAATGELADTSKLLKLLQSPVDIWEQIVEGKMLVDAAAAAAAVPSSDTPAGMNEIPTPTGADFLFEGLPTQGGYSVRDILDSISLD